MCKLTEGHAKELIETVERLYITVATIPFDTFSKGVDRQMVHHLGKYIFAGKHTAPFSFENE
jgi:CMP-2-keto-3-deoxyoctulosonic acid synthetase